MWCDIIEDEGKKRRSKMFELLMHFYPCFPSTNSSSCQSLPNRSKPVKMLLITLLEKKIQEEKKIYIKWNQENSCNLCKASYGVREIKWRIKFDWIYEKKSMNWRDTKIGFKIMMLFKLNHLTKKLSTFNWTP